MTRQSFILHCRIFSFRRRRGAQRCQPFQGVLQLLEDVGAVLLALRELWTKINVLRAEGDALAPPQAGADPAPAAHAQASEAYGRPTEPPTCTMRACEV